VFRPLEEATPPSETYGVWPAGSPNVLVPRLLDAVLRSLGPRAAAG
jgi:hypothetical protein